MVLVAWKLQTFLKVSSCWPSVHWCLDVRCGEVLCSFWHSHLFQELLDLALVLRLGDFGVLRDYGKRN